MAKTTAPPKARHVSPSPPRRVPPSAAHSNSLKPQDDSPVIGVALTDLEAFPALSRSPKKDALSRENETNLSNEASGASTKVLTPCASPAIDLETDDKHHTNTWKDLFARNSGKLSKKGKPYTLESGELYVTISNDIIKRNHSRWKEFIIGQFQGNLPSKGALHGILNGIWSKQKRDLTISKQGPKTVLIRIPCAITRRRVLNQRAWHIERKMMFVGEWEPGMTPTIPEMKEAPVWLDIVGVHALFFAKEALEQIASLVGEPIFLHPSTANLTNLEVARVFTIVDITKPLPDAVYVRDEIGKSFRIEVSSPWLPPTCEHCMEIGHTLKLCPTAPILCVACNSTTHSHEECTRKSKKTTSKKEFTRKHKKVDTPTPTKMTSPTGKEVNKDDTQAPAYLTSLIQKKVKRATSPLRKEVNTATTRSQLKRQSLKDSTIASSSKSKGKRKETTHTTTATDTSSSEREDTQDSSEYSDKEQENSAQEIVSSTQEDSSETDDNPPDSTRLIQLVSKKDRQYKRAQLRKETRTK